MFSQVQQALGCLGEALEGVEAATTGELRQTVGLAKSLRTRVELLETKAASLVAEREGHGDGGAGLLNQIGGRSRSDAARNVRTDAGLDVLPAARTGLSDGEISLANAAKLAQAARKISPQAVQEDADLVHLAKTLPEDEFAQAAQRWTIRHQNAEDLAAQQRRNRRNRSVRFWNGDDGSVQMRGSFDAEMGARIQQRLRHQAEQLRQADRRRQTRPQPDETAPDDGDTDTCTVPEAAVRSRDQRMADALDTLIAASTPPPRTAQVPKTRGEPEGDATAPSCNGETDGSHRTEPDSQAAPPPPVGGKTAAAQIIVRADLAALTGLPGGTAEICGIGPIPPSTLQRLACNSDIWIEIFDDELTPLYETVASRAPTAAQRRALIARDGACIGCGEPPGECEAHHIIPCQRGGKTRLDNLVLVCWSCHDLIHDHNWRVVVGDDRYRLAPPDPAHPHNPAPQRKPERRAPQPTAEHRSPQQAPNTDKPPPAPAAIGSLWEDPAA